MTTITLENTGKRYGRDWIFRKINYQFSQGKSYALLGPNGSGKSTLLQLIAGNQSPTEGAVKFYRNNQIIETEDAFRHISLCAPYMQLIEEFTLMEQLRFHFSFKTGMSGMTGIERMSGKTGIERICGILGLERHADKQIRHFSSGMKQRVKLCLAVLSEVPVVLLDEPATNLDEAGVKWYKDLLKNYLNDRLLIISSNRLEEYEMCGERILVEEYK